jgi:hypothetical protein
MSELPAYLYESDRLIGSVVEVGPSRIRLNLPLASADEPQLRHGQRVGAGEVGEFVIVDSGDVAILGRITLVQVPERDRQTVQPRFGEQPTAHPIGTAQLLCTVPVDGGAPIRGISRHPRLGARVYSLEPDTVSWIVEHAGEQPEGDQPQIRLSLAHLPDAPDTNVQITPERLFGRHCAVLGATGGGKSWTLARIVERCAATNAKVLLLDATGEYHHLTDGVRHLSLGEVVDRPASTTAVSMPYRDLVLDDLFALFRPAGQVQAPKLRDAIRSLKLAALEPTAKFVQDGCVPKENQHKAAFLAASRDRAGEIEDAGATFDLTQLATQIEHECVWSTGRGSTEHWGGADQNARSYCFSLVSRIESHLSTPELRPVLRPSGTSVLKAIESWLAEPDMPILRISLRNLSFSANVREIVVNGLGRQLLQMARDGRFVEHPLVVCLDEAHQFLSKSLGDEFSRYPLDAFDLIAKEGRKYSLSLCIATQRPRDIPEAVLGQMGTLLVHRLTNDADRHVVERAAGDLDRSAAAFLPTLAPGQALLLGVDYPIPLVIAVTPPAQRPDSRGPNYQEHWQPVPSGDTPAR